MGTEIPSFTSHFSPTEIIDFGLYFSWSWNANRNYLFQSADKRWIVRWLAADDLPLICRRSAAHLQTGCRSSADGHLNDLLRRCNRRRPTGSSNFAVFLIFASLKEISYIIKHIYIHRFIYNKWLTAETVRLQYILNMLSLACCETTLKPHKQYLITPKRLVQSLGEFGSGP
jgi:hypothetical protein